MLQWMQSKIVMMAAGLLLISSISAAFYYQMDSMEEEEMENRVRKIARVISEVDDSSSDRTKQILTFEESSKGIYIPPEIRGEPYSIKMTEDYVKIEKDDRSSLRDLKANVHFWNPENLNESGILKAGEEEWRDSRTGSMKIRAGESDIELIMMDLKRGETNENHVFVNGVDKS